MRVSVPACGIETRNRTTMTRKAARQHPDTRHARARVNAPYGHTPPDNVPSARHTPTPASTRANSTAQHARPKRLLTVVCVQMSYVRVMTSRAHCMSHAQCCTPLANTLELLGRHGARLDDGTSTRTRRLRTSRRVFLAFCRCRRIALHGRRR